MATSEYSYHPFHTIGAARLLLWDDAAAEGGGAWAHFGKVADASVLMTTEQAGKDITVKGLTQPVARRNRSKRYSLSFRLLENANPAALELLYGEGAAQGTGGAEVVVERELMRLYGGDYSELAHPYGIQLSQPAAAASAGASAGGTGGSITPGTYYYWVVPLFSKGGSAIFEGDPAATGATAVGSSEQVTVTFSAPEGYTASEYRIYVNSSDDLASAELAADMITASPHVLGSHAGGGSSLAQSGELLLVQSTDLVTTYTEGSDYTLDAEKGLIKRITGGSIADGAQVVVTYAYMRPATALTALGCPVELERYRRVKLLQLAPEADGGDSITPSNWRETGVEFEFFKVNAAINDAAYPFSEDDFSEGIGLTWECMFDGSEGSVGTVRSTYGVLAQYS